MISHFKLSDRKDQQQTRITSVVYNPRGSEILASYSSESVYLLDPKQSISQETMNDHLVEHRNRVQPSNNTKENKPTVDNSEKTSPVKRLRLRGDWSDTGRVFPFGFLPSMSFAMQVLILVHLMMIKHRQQQQHLNVIHRMLLCNV